MITVHISGLEGVTRYERSTTLIHDGYSDYTKDNDSESNFFYQIRCVQLKQKKGEMHHDTYNPEVDTNTNTIYI